MPDFPSLPPIFIPDGSIHSYGKTSFLGDTEDLTNIAYTSATIGTANRALAIAFFIDVPVTIYKIMWENGVTVAGNVDVGIYNTDLSRVISSGSIAQSGVSSIQVADIADTRLSPGEYYMALATSSSTATFMKSSKSGYLCTIGGIYQAASSFPLPNPIAFDIPSSSVPVNGMPALALTLRSEVG